METIATIFSRGKRRTAKAQKRLVMAYRRTFRGEGDMEDAEIVLVDLARSLGYYHTTEPSDDTEQLWFNEGKRAAFGHIQKLLQLPSETLDALASRVIMEDQASRDEGEEL